MSKTQGTIGSAGARFPFRVAAVDLDGTLLGPDKTVSRENKKAVEALQAHGCQIVMASGRRHEDILPAYHFLGLRTPIISCDGIVIKTPLTEEVILEKTLHQTIAHTLVQEAHSHGVGVYYYHTESVFYSRPTEWTLAYQACTRSRQPIFNEFLHELRGYRAQKLVFCDHPERIKELKPGLLDRYDEHLQVIESEPGFLEFMPKGTSKFTAIQELCSRMGHSAEEALAFGDNWNDEEILANVGFGVAMTDASEGAKKAAKAVSGSGPANTSFARAVDLVFERFYPLRDIKVQSLNGATA